MHFYRDKYYPRFTYNHCESLFAHFKVIGYWRNTMKRFIGVAASVLMASSFAFTQAASADSTAATCEFYSHGDKKKDRSGPCSFSQRQGYVDIGLSNGKTFNLTPGNKPDHFRDQEDHKVVREHGDGGSQVYKWDEKKIVVTFN